MLMRKLTLPQHDPVLRKFVTRPRSVSLAIVMHSKCAVTRVSECDERSRGSVIYLQYYYFRRIAVIALKAWVFEAPAYDPGMRLPYTREPTTNI